MRMTLILRRIVIFGTFLVPFTPLIVTSSLFFPYITGKGFFFRIIVITISAAWIMLALRDRSWLPRPSTMLLALSSFLIAVAVADGMSENPYKSFWGNFERMEGFVTIAHLFLYFLVAASVLARNRLWPRFFDTSVGVSIGVALYGISQFVKVSPLTQGARIESTFGNATYLAGYMLVHVFLTLLLAFRKRGMNWSIYYGTTICIQCLMLFLTATRGAILALFGGSVMLALGFLVFGRDLPKLRRISAEALILFVIIAGLIFGAKDTAFVRGNKALSRITSISLESAGPRIALWKIAFAGVKERPMLGWGQESFNFVFNKYYRPELHGQEQWFDRTHNIFLDWLVGTGSLGLLAYISIFIVALRYIWKCNVFRREEQVILTALVAAYVFHNLFVFDNIGSYIFFFSLLAFIHARATENLPRPAASFAGHREVHTGFITPVIVFIALFTLYQVNIPDIRAAYFLLEARKTLSEDPLKNIEYFERALAENTFAKQEIREQLVLTAWQIVEMKNAPDDLKNRFLDRVRTEMGEQMEAVPHDARFPALLAGLYKHVGDLYQHSAFYDEAVRLYERALVLSPGKQVFLVELGNTHIAKGEAEKGFAYIERVYTDRPYDMEMKHLYVVAATYAGKDDIVHKIYSTETKEFRVDPRMFEAYYRKGRWADAAEVGEMLIFYFPKNVDYHVRLAAPYLNLGRIGEAKAEIRKAMELNPSFRAQGERLLDDIDTGKIGDVL